MINVLYEDNHLLVVEKPVNIPVQEDASGDDDLLSLCKAYLKEKYNKPGNVYLGLVHRLDRPVGGVMVFAKTSKAASRLSDAVRRNAFGKQYLAIIDGPVSPDKSVLKDYLVKDRSSNTVRTTDEAHGKYCELSYSLLAQKQNRSLVQIDLKTGRSHQIRVQFASRGMPLLNDQRYHPHPEKGQIALWASRLSFVHPVTKKQMVFQSYPRPVSPWNVFEESIYGKTGKEE
ncbi:MAG: RNA pseudouridine synthase [Solobacterium sp.]|nr:RNA pseudouridine synthase [Solobacterium sp.]